MNAPEPGNRDRPLVDLRTFTIIAAAVLVGVLAGAYEDIAAGIVAALGVAATLHTLIARRPAMALMERALQW